MAHPTISVKILNQCSQEINDVRITHFPGKNNTGSQVFIQAVMPQSGPGVTDPSYPFTGVDGLDDNWCVAFKLGDGVFMSRKVTKNLDADRSDYHMIIRLSEFVVECTHKGTPESKSTPVNTVFNILG